MYNREFDFGSPDPVPSIEPIAAGAVVLRAFALPFIDFFKPVVDTLDVQQSFQNRVTPSGMTMSVAMTNLGKLGWMTDHRGYRYTEYDPASGQPWPAMPESFARFATSAAAAAGYARFDPDACLVNCYVPGARLALHQDRDELDLHAPIVSVSMGIPATFLFGGMKRTDIPLKIPLFHGDVVVWGGASRLRYHGVMAIRECAHPVFGRKRINLTFRKAG